MSKSFSTRVGKDDFRRKMNLAGTTPNSVQRLDIMQILPPSMMMVSSGYLGMTS